MANSPDLFAALEAAHQEIQEERRQLAAREQALLRAREELAQALGGNGTPTAHRGTRVRTRAGVQQKASQMHMDAISDYLTGRGAVRQADIGKALGLNSGTVSLALRQLEQDGLVEPLPEKERGSVVWQTTAPRDTVSSPRPRALARR